MGLEPTTFEFEVQRADPLRHEGTALMSNSVVNELSYSKFYLILKYFKFFVHCR